MPREKRTTGRLRGLAINLLVAITLALLVWIGAARAAEPLSVAAYGDSLMAGYGLPREDGFPARLQAALNTGPTADGEAGPSVQVIDASVSGDTSAGGVSRLDWTLAETPDVAIVGLGGNDLLRALDPALTRRNLDQIIGTLKARGVVVVLAGMMAPRSLGEPYWRAFDAIYPELAAQHGIRLVPLLLDGVATDPALNQPDGIHPNADGAQRMVANVLPAVRDALAEAAARRQTN